MRDASEVALGIRQISPSLGEACGIAYFAQRLDAELSAAGCRVETVKTPFVGVPEDILLVHHHGELLEDDAVRKLAAQTTCPLVLMPHADDARHLYPLAAGVVAMSPALVEDAPAPHVFPHPAWVPQRLSPRAELRARLGLPQNAIIVGSNGFLKFERSFDFVTDRLLCLRQDVFVYLVLSPWRLQSPGLVDRLEAIGRAHPGRLRVDYETYSQEALNLRLQACDLLWCWIDAPSRAYASGVVSDQYASGTRMVVSAKQQHAHVAGFENVLWAEGDRENFVAILARAAHKPSPRHSPERIAWARQVDRLIEYFARISKRS